MSHLFVRRSRGKRSSGSRCSSHAGEPELCKPASEYPNSHKITKILIDGKISVVGCDPQGKVDKLAISLELAKAIIGEANHSLGRAYAFAFAACLQFGSLSRDWDPIAMAYVEKKTYRIKEKIVVAEGSHVTSKTKHHCTVEATLGGCKARFTGDIVMTPAFLDGVGVRDLWNEHHRMLLDKTYESAVDQVHTYRAGPSS